MPDNFTRSTILANEIHTVFYNVQLIKNNKDCVIESKYDLV